jgi:hypothetical protein
MPLKHAGIYEQLVILLWTECPVFWVLILGYSRFLAWYRAGQSADGFLTYRTDWSVGGFLIYRTGWLVGGFLTIELAGQ